MIVIVDVGIYVYVGVVWWMEVGDGVWVWYEGFSIFGVDVVFDGMVG